MRDFWTGSRGPAGNSGSGLDPRDERRLLATGIAVALAVFWASLAPGVLFAAALGGILFFAALAMAVVALLRDERVVESRLLTAWDQAAFFLALSIAAGWFVDPDAVEAALGSAVLAAPGAAG